jgi:glutamate-1-semialdehyde 2,1-aminomutase
LERYRRHFDEKCATSKQQIELAKKSIPSGIQHNLANNMPFPLSADRVDGAYLYDVDGNRYIDLLQAGGPTILGNNYGPVRDKIVELIMEKGPLTGLYSDYERLLAEEVKKHFPTVEKIRMMGSGTEADLLAIRLARAYTGKKNIVRIAGNYHGWSDMIYSHTDIGTPGDIICGALSEWIEFTRVIPPNDIDALENTFKECESRGGTAAFILEGVGQDSGALPLTTDFHKGARALCDRYGVLMIYDEVVTAFRLGLGGAQAHYGTKADLTVFGKIIGGGYPSAGAVGGKAEIMDMLAAGLSKDRAYKVRAGGTLTANPLSSLAGLLTIQELEKTNAIARLKDAADTLCRAVGDLAGKYNIPALVFNQHSILHIDLTGLQHLHTLMPSNTAEYRQAMDDAAVATAEFAMALAAEGVIIAGGNKSYLNLQTTDILDDIITCYDRVFREFA